MDLAPLATLTAAVLVLAAVLAWAVLASVTGRRRLERDLVATRAELALLRQRVDTLDSRPGSSAKASDSVGSGGYVITSLPDQAAPVSEAGHPGEVGPPSRREFASVALTESVVKMASLAYGVRRALSPESRNRIRFEMGREVKRVRRQRRREVKLARRAHPDSPPDAHRDTRDTHRDTRHTHRAEDAA